MKKQLKISDRQIAVACELMKFGFEYHNFTEESFVMQKKFKNNVVTAFIKFDGKSLRIRINGHATIHHDSNSIKNHYGAKFVVRIKCEIYPNCPRYIPDLKNDKLSIYTPREGEGTPAAPEWKARDYIKNILPEDDPHKAN